MKLPKVVRSLSKTSLSLGYGVDTVFAALTRPPSSTHLVERDDFILASSRVKPNLSSLSDIGIFLTAPSDRISRPRGERFAGSFTYPDRKSTRLNSSHLVISYAVFCLKKI